MANFYEQHKTKIWIVVGIVAFLIILFLLGSLGSGKDLNYIPV